MDNKEIQQEIRKALDAVLADCVDHRLPIDMNDESSVESVRQKILAKIKNRIPLDDYHITLEPDPQPNGTFAMRVGVYKNTD